VVIPCFNEEQNISPLAEQILKLADFENVNTQIIFVDDSSKDNTLAQIVRAAERDPRVLAARHTSNQGIVTSWLTGVKKASSSVIALMDADFQNPPSELFKLYRTFKGTDADAIRGVRVSGAKKNFAPWTWRIVCSKTLNLLLNKTFRMNSRDNKSGFIVGRRDYVGDALLLISAIPVGQTYLGVALSKVGCRVAECETTFEERRSGSSFLSGKTIPMSLAVLRSIPVARRTMLAEMKFDSKREVETDAK